MIKQLIDDLAYDKITLNQGLTRAKIIANKLKDKDFIAWINNELNGYNSVENIPPYRVIPCGLSATISDFYGIRTIPVNATALDERMGGQIYKMKVQQSIDNLEESFTKSTSDIGHVKLPPSLVKMLSEMTGEELIDAGREVQISQLRYIVNQTKQRLIDALLQLDELFPDFESSKLDPSEKKDKIQHIINNHIYGTNNSTNIGIGQEVNQTISTEVVSKKLSELEEIGVDKELLQELKELLKTKEQKSTRTKITTWISKMTSKAIEKGIDYQIPFILDKLNDLIK